MRLIGNSNPAMMNAAGLTIGHIVTLDDSGSGAPCKYSRDNGVSWSSGGASPAMVFRGMAFGAGKFVAVANSTRDIAYSVDGVNWIVVSNALPSASSWWGIKWDGTNFLATVAGSTTAAYSADGITWTSTTLSLSAFRKNGTNGSLFVVGNGANGNVTKSSDHGVNWSSVTTGLGSSGIADICWDGNHSRFIAIPSGGNAGGKSSDGTTWSASTLISVSLQNGWNTCTSNGAGTVVAAGGDGVDTYGAYTTDGGNSWSGCVMTSESGPSFWTVLWNGINFVSVDRTHGSPAYSADGITWTNVIGGVGFTGQFGVAMATNYLTYGTFS